MTQIVCAGQRKKTCFRRGMPPGARSGLALLHARWGVCVRALSSLAQAHPVQVDRFYDRQEETSEEVRRLRDHLRRVEEEQRRQASKIFDLDRTLDACRCCSFARAPEVGRGAEGS